MPRQQAIRKEHNTQSISPLEVAAQRLAGALQRVDTALAKDNKSPAQANYDLFRQENMELKKERERLVESLEKMKMRYEQLRIAASHVAEKLDATIERIGPVTH